MDALKEIEKCSICVGWIFQITIWILFTVSMINKYKVSFILFGIFYFLYFFVELAHPISAYLFYKFSLEKIMLKMNYLFKALPQIKFECFDEKSNNSRIKLFRYRFSKDISSPFVLNLQDINLNKKNYIKLTLNEEIEFADSETADEYAIQKRAFIREMKRKNNGLENEILESRHIPGLKFYISVIIKDKEPICVNFCIFLICICLTLGELYKIYFNSFCSYQSFIIKKIVTTHPYLNRNDFEQNYKNKLFPNQTAELKSKQKRNIVISNQTEFSVIKGVVKYTKDIKQIIKQDINELNIDKQINIEIINEINEQKTNLDFSNGYNNNLHIKDNNGNDSAIIVNNKNIYNIDNNENFSIISVNNKIIYNKENNGSFSGIFVNNKKIHNKDKNESDFINLINKKNSFDILNNK